MRKKKIFGVLRQHLGAIFRELAKHKEVEVLKGHLMSDHVPICLSTPPKYAVSNVVGYIKGKRCNHHSKEVWRSSEELHWRGILGKRLLRIDSRITMKQWLEPTFEIKKQRMNDTTR
jgi:putative transposase